MDNLRELLVRFDAMSVKQEIGADKLQSHSQADQVEQASDSIFKLWQSSTLWKLSRGLWSRCFYLNLMHTGF